MVLRPEPIIGALNSVKGNAAKTVLTSPGGRLLDQALVKELSCEVELCIICGHYEGVDQRVIESAVDLEVSVGDYVLSGGEYAALVILDSMVRYIPGFMSNSDSLQEESFEAGLLEYPQYTRPAIFGGMEVPPVLTGGNHGEIKKWRCDKSIEKTKRFRPDLYRRYIMRKLLGE